MISQQFMHAWMYYMKKKVWLHIPRNMKKYGYIFFQPYTVLNITLKSKSYIKILRKYSIFVFTTFWFCTCPVLLVIWVTQHTQKNRQIIACIDQYNFWCYWAFLENFEVGIEIYASELIKKPYTYKFFEKLGSEFRCNL